MDYQTETPPRPAKRPPIIAPVARTNRVPQHDVIYHLTMVFPSLKLSKYNLSEKAPTQFSSGVLRKVGEEWRTGISLPDGSVEVTQTWRYSGRVRLIGFTESDAAIFESLA